MSGGGAMLNLIFGLAVVLGMLWLLLAGLRRVPALRGLMPASRGRVHASLAVGPRERVVLVEFAGEALVLGVAPGRVSLLKELPAAQLQALAAQDGAAQRTPAP